MTPQEIAERVLSYGTPKEPTVTYLKLVEAAERKQSDMSRQEPVFDEEELAWHNDWSEGPEAVLAYGWTP